MNTKTRAEFGDFQTPLPLARDVCARLSAEGMTADVIIEPTCGRGAFLVAAAERFPRTALRGLDINQAYVTDAATALRQIGALERASIACQDFFTHDWTSELQALPGELLVLGNLPWVTHSAMAAMHGSNLPARENFLGLRGMAARTGKSNFDISEWMLIHLVRALRGRAATIAMLCKTSTARKVLRYAWQHDGQIAKAVLCRIDAAAHFGAAVDACLLFVRTGSAGPTIAEVFDTLQAAQPSSRTGLAGRDLVADIDAYRRLRHLEGLCPFQWRSGLKHDCADLMELRQADDGRFENKLGERLALETQHLFPLLKSSDVAHGRTVPERFVIVTQRQVGEDTAIIADTAPRTWRYLQSHRAQFDGRKSSIYRSQPPFALFGIGDYAFAPWKVAVSGFHRPSRFQLVEPYQGKPVFMDDTCYYLPFEQESCARVVADILNAAPCQRFLEVLTFTGAKRPITVELLQRLNLSALAEEAGLGERWHALGPTGYKTTATMPQLEFVMESAGSGVIGALTNDGAAAR